MECPFPANLFGTKTLIIRAPNIPCPNFDVSAGSGFLLSLSANAAPFEEIVYDNATDDSCVLPPDFSTDNIEIHIVDDKANFVDFNNIDWTIVLFVEYHMTKMEDRIWSLSDVVRLYENQLELAIVEKAAKKRKRKDHDHKYNTRSKHGKKEAKD